MKKGDSILFAVLLFILAGSNSAFGQAEVCICASYSSLQFQADYESVFPHAKIKSEKIKQVIVYTSSHDSIDPTKQLLAKYIELKFDFDNEDYVSSRTHYYLGTPNHIYEFERNASNQITKQTFTYLDSLGQKYLAMPPLITEYTYDKNNRLIKEKQSDYSGKMQEDSKSNYTRYVYRRNGRLIKSTGQLYFDGTNTTAIKISYAYSDNGHTKISRIFNDNKLYSMTCSTVRFARCQVNA